MTGPAACDRAQKLYIFRPWPPLQISKPAVMDWMYQFELAQPRAPAARKKSFRLIPSRLLVWLALRNWT